MPNEFPDSPSEPLRPPDTASMPADFDGDTYRLSSPSPMISGPDDPPVITPMHTVVSTGDKKPVKRSKFADVRALWCYNGLVFITSVCVMTLELTASRLIQKSVGSSLYTWTSVIGVVLAGITLGNFLGGWLADRFHRGRMLAWMYLFASISCASVLWLDQLVTPMSRPNSISLPTWVLLVVSAMFLLPSLALGTISPLVASLALSRSSRTGTTVGNVYAWGALGSIIGTFLTGFYLMDVFGTRTIIGLTAGTLGLLAIVVAGAPRLFRVAVVCGWLQLLGWTVLAATGTPHSMAAAAQTFGSVISIAQPSPLAIKTRASWNSFGNSIGTKLQELGLLLKLRDDRLGAYYDESSYSTITVTTDEIRGHTVKYLRLDKLIHSYYDPANPTELHYEYEQIYAAVTKRTATSLLQPVTLSTKPLPPEYLSRERLPAGTTLDDATGELRIEQPTSAIFDSLLALAPAAELWKAIDELHAETNKPNWVGFSFAKFDSVPDDYSFPEDVGRMIMFDKSIGRITAYEAVTNEVRERLINSTPLNEWYREVQRARGVSRRATSLFIGGGGYIFPRWFLKEFPGSSRIDVAELDPAVLQAAINAMGLTENEQQRIRTTIGDARNVIDDQLRDNRRLVATGSTPIKYDFIYGDAFNDFSIPAHLTTIEYLQKVENLLTDDGVFLANLIDIYPRYEYPGTSVSEGEATYQGPLPIGLNDSSLVVAQYESAGAAFAPLEIKMLADQHYRIRARRVITSEEQVRLSECEWPALPEDQNLITPWKQAWSTAINQVALETQRRIPFSGTIPASLLQPDAPLEAWKPAFRMPFVDTYRMSGDQYVLGFRGLITADVEAELLNLDPSNKEWQTAVRTSAARSRKHGPGRFLGRYVATAAAVFPNLYLFSTAGTQPSSNRDTFVLVCSHRPLHLEQMKQSSDWKGEWFAAMETSRNIQEPLPLGQMTAVLSLSEGKCLTDDFAPVDNLLVPVVAE